MPGLLYVINKLGEALAQAEADLEAVLAERDALRAKLAETQPDTAPQESK